MTSAPHPAGDGLPTGRRSRGRPSVPPDRIIETALRIVDEEGADALSMRVLAHRLNSSTATLYRHFAGRADLIACIVDQMFAHTGASADELAAMGWPEASRALVRGLFDTLRQHKNVAALIVERLPVGPHSMAFRERCVSVLLEGGFPPRLAARSYAALARYALGFAIQMSDGTNREHPHSTRLATLLRDLDTSAYPATAAIADVLPAPLEEEFTFGLNLLINGLAQERDATPRWRT